MLLHLSLYKAIYNWGLTRYNKLLLLQQLSELKVPSLPVEQVSSHYKLVLQLEVILLVVLAHLQHY